MHTRSRRAALVVPAAAVSVLLLGVGPASAHVSVSAPGAAPGGFGEITFRMPSESDTARSTSLRVQLPAETPLAFVSVEPVPGWTATVTKAPLAAPLEVEGTTVTEAAREVTWTADPGAGLSPGQYQSFSISAGPLPEDAAPLTFPALQGYDDGSTVAWIEPTVAGQEEPEHPAPTLALTAVDSPAPAGTPADTPADAPAAAPGDNDSGLAVAGLVVGTGGLLLGATGVVLALGARRRATSSPATGVRDGRERETASV